MSAPETIAYLQELEGYYAAAEHDRTDFEPTSAADRRHHIRGRCGDGEAHSPTDRLQGNWRGPRHRHGAVPRVSARRSRAGPAVHHRTNQPRK